MVPAALVRDDLAERLVLRGVRDHLLRDRLGGGGRGGRGLSGGRGEHMPAVAAATAAPVRAFFGVAMRRMMEMDTENLFFGDRAVARTPCTGREGWACVGAEARVGSSAPCDCSRETGSEGVRNDPFY